MRLCARADGCTRHFRKYYGDDLASGCEKAEWIKSEYKICSGRGRVFEWIRNDKSLPPCLVRRLKNNITKKKGWRKFMKIIRSDLLIFSVPSRLDADEWFREIKFVLAVSRGMPHRTAYRHGKSVEDGGVTVGKYDGMHF